LSPTKNTLTDSTPVNVCNLYVCHQNFNDMLFGRHTFIWHGWGIGTTTCFERLGDTIWPTGFS